MYIFEDRAALKDVTEALFELQSVLEESEHFASVAQLLTDTLSLIRDMEKAMDDAAVSYNKQIDAFRMRCEKAEKGKLYWQRFALARAEGRCNKCDCNGGKNER